MPTGEPERTAKIRQVLSELEERCESLRVRAKESQPLIGQANDLVVKRDAASEELRSTQTAEQRRSVAQTIDDYKQKIRRLTEPLDRLRADTQHFASELNHLLKQLPLGGKNVLKIRSEIFDIPLIQLPLKQFPCLPLVGADKDLEVLGIRLQDLGEALSQNQGREHNESLIRPVQVPRGTRWDDLSIRFTSDDRVQLFVGNKPKEIRTFEEMGFADKRTSASPGTAPSRTKAWEFLCRLAEAGAEGLPTSKLSEAERPEAEKRVQEIRKRLKQLFPNLSGDPFEDVRKLKSYKLKLDIMFPESDRL